MFKKQHNIILQKCRHRYVFPMSLVGLNMCVSHFMIILFFVVFAYCYSVSFLYEADFSVKVHTNSKVGKLNNSASQEI